MPNPTERAPRQNAVTHALHAKERRLKILEALRDYWEREQLGPTVEELAEESGFGRTTVVVAIRTLQEEGLVYRDSRQRSLRPL